MAQFNYNQNIITVSDDLLLRYSKEAGPIDDTRIKYFAVTSGCTKDMSCEELEARITAAIRSELDLYENKEVLIKAAFDNGVLTPESLWGDGNDNP